MLWSKPLIELSSTLLSEDEDDEDGTDEDEDANDEEDEKDDVPDILLDAASILEADDMSNGEDDEPRSLTAALSNSALRSVKFSYTVEFSRLNNSCIF